MPELPEVESLTRKIAALITGCTIQDIKFLRANLRAPIPTRELRKFLIGQKVDRVWRRSKYMLWECEAGSAIFHFGMSGIMVLQDKNTPLLNHTHAIFTITDGEHDRYLHYVDPRRFGVIAYAPADGVMNHPLFAKLGVEPLTHKDLGGYLYQAAQNKRAKIALKPFLMDGTIVVGVGNIYASEALFLAGFNPERVASTLTLVEYKNLAKIIVQLLKRSIAKGGTTFRDFYHPDAKPGYFALSLNVYGREGEPCKVCQSSIMRITQTGRSSFFCANCQCRWHDDKNDL